MAMFWFQSQTRESKAVLVSSAREKEALIRKLVDLDGQKVSNYVTNNSWWDEFVTAVNKNDQKWIADNLETSSKMQGILSVAVVKPNGELVYRSKGQTEPRSEDIESTITFTGAKHKLTRFNYWSEGKCYAIDASPIGMSADPMHIGEPSGYLIAVSFWGPDKMYRISKLAEGEATLLPIDSQVPQVKNEGSYLVTIPVEGGKKETIGNIYVQLSSQQVIANLRNIRTVAWSGVIAVLGIFLLITLLVRQWLLRPLQQLSRTIEEKNVAYASRYSGQQDEVGRLANAVMESAVQQEQLSQLNDKLSVQTELLEAEVSAKQSAMGELNVAYQKRTEFLNYLSHELRTPLNSVLGFAQLIKLRTQDEKIVSGADSIISGGNHLLSLVNEVLDLARVDAGKINLNIANFNAVEVISETSDMVAPLLKEQGVQLLIELDPNSQIVVEADRKRLLQILLNLTTNAIKYNRPNGTVVIGMQQTINGTCMFTVRDSGVGIAEADQARLFTAFERFGAQSGVGTGLGLQYSKRVAEVMGGDVILLESTPEGSVFAVEIPLAASCFVLSCSPNLLEHRLDPLQRLISCSSDGTPLKEHVEGSGVDIWLHIEGWSVEPSQVIAEIQNWIADKPLKLLGIYSDSSEDMDRWHAAGIVEWVGLPENAPRKTA